MNRKLFIKLQIKMKKKTHHEATNTLDFGTIHIVFVSGWGLVDEFL